VTVEILRFYNIDGGRFQQVISGASTKSLNQGAHRRYVAPLNYKLDVRNVQTLLMISRRTLKRQALTIPAVSVHNKPQIFPSRRSLMVSSWNWELIPEWNQTTLSFI
jgi:hypothetical protein